MSNVVVGGGHFVERGGQVVQEFANHVQVGSRTMNKLEEMKGAIDNCFGWTEKYTHENCEPFPEYKQVQNVYTSSGINISSSARPPQPSYTLCSNDSDSNAWIDRCDDFRNSHLGGFIKEFGLALGSGIAGDGQGAIEHGASAAEEWWKSVQEMADKADAFRGTWQNDAR